MTAGLPCLSSPDDKDYMSCQCKDKSDRNYIFKVPVDLCPVSDLIAQMKQTVDDYPVSKKHKIYGQRCNVLTSDFFICRIKSRQEYTKAEDEKSEFPGNNGHYDERDKAECGSNGKKYLYRIVVSASVFHGLYLEK